MADLDGERATQAAIARATGLHRSTVSRAVRRLEQWGLADHTEDGWGAVDIPEVTGGLARRRRRRRHQTDRDRRRQWLVEDIGNPKVDLATGEVQDRKDTA